MATGNTPQEAINDIKASRSDIAASIRSKGVNVPDNTKLGGLASYVDAIPTAADIPAAGTELGTVKSGGNVTISNGIITVKDDSHNHVISNVDGLQDALNGKQPSGSYVIRNGTGVQSITGGLVVGGTSAQAANVGRIMVTGSTNPLIGLQAINASGTQLTPYYFQVSNDVMYLGPTSSKALAFDSDGNTSIPAALSVAGTIKENGVDLSSKYATPTFVDGKFEALEDKIPTKTSDLQNDSGFATETYVDNKVAGIVDSSPEALNTLNELAAALGDNPNFSTDVLNLIGQKANTTGGNSFTGKQIFDASNSYNTVDTQKFIVGNSSSAFVIGGDGLQCFSGINSTTGKVFYINYYGGDVIIGKAGSSQNINLQGTVKENGTALSEKYVTNTKLEEVLGSYVNDIDALLGG